MVVWCGGVLWCGNFPIVIQLQDRQICSALLWIEAIYLLHSFKEIREAIKKIPEGYKVLFSVFLFFTSFVAKTHMKYKY